MDAGVFRGVQRAAHIRHPHTLLGLSRAAQAVLLPESQPGLRVERGPKHRQMMLAPGKGQDSAFVKLSVDVLPLAYTVHFVDRVIHGKHQGARGFAPMAVLKRGRRHGKFGGAPSAIAPGSAEACDLFFQ